MYVGGDPQIGLCNATRGGGSKLCYLGVVSLIDGNVLASQIGLTAGTAINDTAPFLHFELNGNAFYMAQKPFRHSLTWNQIHARGAVFGTATVTINSDTYNVRLLKGANADPAASGDDHDIEQSWGSEWNRLMYPLVPNPTNTPTRPVSREGITYGEWSNYTETELNLGAWGGNGRLSLCQESSGSNRVRRGYTGLSDFGISGSSTAALIFGWRPVLELVE